jgi:nicotinamidase-related amidase
VADLLAEIQRRDPRLAPRIRLLDDCSSAVCVPGVVDYTDRAEAAYRGFAAAGMRIVSSTDPSALIA